MKKIGIIVARFQTSYLHEGHTALIRYVKERNDRVIVFIGTSPSRITKSNPLPYEARRLMVLSSFPNIEVFPLPDYKYDSFWNSELDKKIESLCDSNDNIVLYGDRKSFIGGYAGKFRVEFANITVHGISATKIRTGHHGFQIDSRDWRKGIIFASGYKYPVSFQAVDVAIIKEEEGGKTSLLLGKKIGEPLYRFIGGFVDPTDESLERSAKREAIEECGDIELDEFKYIGSYRIDDWRYRNEPDKIMTALFCCKYIFGRVCAKDDIDSLSWIELDSISQDEFEPEHRILFDALKQHLKK